MTSRREVPVATLPSRGAYPWLTASLIPRPIAWVSTVSAEGVPNVAPHSFTTVAGIDPPTVCFVSVGAKDSLANARATGEYVLNVGGADLLHPMNETATDFPPEVDEFSAAGLVAEPSAAVRAPRVAGAPVAFECRVSGEYTIGECVTVFGQVLHISVRDDVLAGDGLPDAAKIAPLSRLGRQEWSTLGEVFTLPRIRYKDWQQGRRSGDAR